MKTKIIALAACLIGAHTASAITLTDNNPADTLLIAGISPSYTGTFTLSPYNPLTQQVNSAFTTFTLFDVILNESYTITLGGSTVHTGNSFIGTINLGPSGVAGSALLTLSDTGALSYTVTANTGSFWLTNAYLEAEVGARSPGGANGVPDGGSTVLLLGAGLMGLAAVRRFGARAA
jgi:hypothetical protein